MAGVDVRFASYGEAARVLHQVYPERRCAVAFDGDDDGLTVAIAEFANTDLEQIVRSWIVRLEGRAGVTRPQLFCRWAEREVSRRDTVLEEMLGAHAKKRKPTLN